MKVTDLIELGFNRNEAIVYLALAKFGQADASRIIKDTKFHKNIVYDNLQKLIDKGLVSYITENNRRVFTLEQPHMLTDYLERQTRELQERTEKSKGIAQDIARMAKTHPFVQEARIFRGVQGVKAFYTELQSIPADSSVFGAPKESIEIMGEPFWRVYSKRQRESKTRMRLIFNESLRSYGESIRDANLQIRFFEREFEPLTETIIKGDIVAIVVWTHEPVLFCINDPSVANNYLHYFEKMWKESKK